MIAQDGKHMSKDPIPKKRAEAQMKALYASERREEEARVPTAREEKAIEKKMEGGALRGGATHKDRFERVISLLMDWIDADEIAPILLFDVYNIAPRNENNELGEVTQQHLDAVRAYLQPQLDDNKMSDITDILDDDGVVVAGGGPLPELSILQQIAKASYSTSPPQQIGPFRLRSSTPTLKFYVLPDPEDQRYIDTVVVGIRGTNTSDKQDLWADTQLALGKLEETPRWKKDLADFQSFMSRIRDPDSVDIYGVGHSLGGAVLDMFLKKGLIKQGVSYNPAISKGDAQKDLNNRRIYQDGDPLLAIMGRSAKNVEVRPKKVKEQSVGRKIANVASYFIPYVGLVTKGMDTLDAHALDNFTGGYTSKITAKPDVISRLEDIAVVKRSKGYWVYANDGETQESMRWGPFTKKVAEFEKRLLHQRQRHHLQPIAEESDEGGVRGGAGTIPLAREFRRQVFDVLNPMIMADYEGLHHIASHIMGTYKRLKNQLVSLRRANQQDEKIKLVGQWASDTINYIIDNFEGTPEDVEDKSNYLHNDILLPFLHKLGFKVDVGEEEGEEEEGEEAPAPAPAPAPAERRAEFAPMRPRGRGKFRGSGKYVLTADGERQYKDWIDRNVKIEHHTLTELNNLKTILTNGSNIPADQIQKVVLEFGTNWNRACRMLLDMTEEGDSASRLGFGPSAVRRRASGRGKSLYAGGSGKPSPLGPNYVKTPAVRRPSKIREPVVRTAPVDPRHIERLEKERREVREKETDSSRRADDEVAGLFGRGHSDYLRQAKAKAKAYGLDPKKLTLGEGKHKLSYDGVGFGLKTYKDHLLWSAEEKAGRVPKGTAEKKRKAYLARATKIKGDWKQNKVSPNNLAIHILW